MFEQSLIPQGHTRQPWTLLLAFVGQLALVGLAILIPLAYVQPLPMRDLTAMLLAPPPPPPPPPPPAPSVHRPHQPKVVPRQFVAGRLFEPTSVPKHIAVVKDVMPPLPDGGIVGGVLGGVPGGQIGGVIGGILNSVATPSLPPPPPPLAKAPAPAPAPTPKLVRVGGDIEQARLIREVKPAYPQIARAARVQGEVELEAIIGKDGRIKELSLISGHPLLVRAALNAVKQWAYKPTLLNGQPVEVETQIDVHFNLS